MMGKRGQITVFIIIALVLIGAIGLFLYIKQQMSIFRPDLVIPTELLPLDNYVKESLQSASKDAITLMGAQSGFVEIPDIIRNQRASHLALDPARNFIMPFWIYNGEVRYPSIPYMEADLNRYIEESIDSYLNNFEDFTNEFEITTYADMKVVTTQIADDVVKVELYYPLKVLDKKTTKKTKLARFSIELDLRLGKIHRLAEDILNAELDGLYLENLTLNLMAMNPDIPFTDMKFECGSRRWYLSDIKLDLQDLLYMTLPRIRVKGTNYLAFDNPQEQYQAAMAYKMADIQSEQPSRRPKLEDLPNDFFEYSRLYWDVGSTTPELKAGISYAPSYGLEIAAYPSTNGILKERSAKGASQFLRFLCINMYHFTYDVRYPAKITISDDSAFGGEGYTFSFALPITINKNQPTNEKTTIRSFEGFEKSEGFCESASATPVEIRAKGVYDGLTNMEIPGVNISYACFTQKCDLGKTGPTGGHYALVTQLPTGCANPIIIANKEGYLEGRAQLLSSDSSIDVPMKKMARLNFTILKHQYNSRNSELGGAGSLADKESAVISISALGTKSEQFIYYNLTEKAPSYIEVAEEGAAYSIQASLIRTGYTGDSIAGGYYADNLTITAAEVEGKSAIEMHLVDYRPEPTSDAELAAFGNYLFESSYKDALRPTFK